MLIIDSEKNNAMTIVSKDTGGFVLSLEGYILGPGDRITFTVNSAVEIKKPLIQVMVEEFDEESHTATIFLTQEDTNLEPGNYLYDVQLDTADGRTDTIMGPSKFKVVGGVTY